MRASSHNVQYLPLFLLFFFPVFKPAIILNCIARKHFQKEIIKLGSNKEPIRTVRMQINMNALSLTLCAADWPNVVHPTEEKQEN
jgi:hypothetical protein